jgi:hypothetical protein
MLREGATSEAIAAHLSDVRSDRMVLGPSVKGEKTARDVAVHLHKWYQQEMRAAGDG